MSKRGPQLSLKCVITIQGQTRMLKEWLVLLYRGQGLTHRGVSEFLTANGFRISYEKCRKRYADYKRLEPDPLPDDFECDPAFWNEQGIQTAEPHDPTVEDNARESAERATLPEGSQSFKVDSAKRMTANDLMVEMGLKPEEWIIVSFEARTKQVVRKREAKALEAENGRWTGTVSAAPGLSTLYAYSLKVKPRLAAQKIQVVQVTLQNRSPMAARRNLSTLRRMLLVSDPQIGYNGQRTYHDRDVLSLALDVAEMHDSTLDHIVFTGDLLDFDQFSKWSSDQSVADVQHSIFECAYWLAAFRRACPNTEIDIIEGNHDMRLRVSLARQVPGVAGLAAAVAPNTPVLGIAHLVGLNDLHIRLKQGWPGNDAWYGDYLNVGHGESYGSAPGASVAKILKLATENTIYGHSHHAEMASKTMPTSKGPRTITAISLPCACKIDGSVPSRNANPDWHQGFALVTFDMDSRLIEYEPILVQNGRAIWNDSVIKGCGADHEAALRATYEGFW
jgi:hypothetical protein